MEENFMSEPNKLNNSEAVPFFARYLEGQNIEELSEEEMEEIGGSRNSVTGRSKDEVTTLKYPSDREDAVTRQTKDDIFVTLKYPSDNDEKIQTLG